MSTDDMLDDNGTSAPTDPETRQRLYVQLILQSIGKTDPRPAVVVNRHTSVSDAIALMKEQGIGCVLVTEANRLVGIFTERDVLFRVVGNGRDPQHTAVEDVMTPDPESLTMEDELAWVLNFMAVGGFRHVPIVDADGLPIAVLSVKNIVERLVELFPNDVLNLPPHPGKNITRTREGA